MQYKNGIIRAGTFAKRKNTREQNQARCTAYRRTEVMNHLACSGADKKPDGNFPCKMQRLNKGCFGYSETALFSKANDMRERFCASTSEAMSLGDRLRSGKHKFGLRAVTPRNVNAVNKQRYSTVLLGMRHVDAHIVNSVAPLHMRGFVFDGFYGITDVCRLKRRLDLGAFLRGRIRKNWLAVKKSQQESAGG